MEKEEEEEKPDARLGALLGDNNKYRVDEVLGRGGMGTVYRGTRLDLGERVAMKFLHSMFASTSDLRARFKQEAIALARLRHPAIVALLDYGEHDGDLYMVMELVKGETLASMVEAEGALSLPFVGAVFDQLLEVLALAHAEGIVHRDLKPSNVMIIPPTHVKLLDFGLVHLPAGQDIEKLTQTGVIHGTPDYMSPEQCQGDPVGPKSDVYALGAMLYECLVGHAPFEGRRGAGQLMAAHLFVPPPSLPKDRGLPMALDVLLRRALAKNVDQRPTAEEMRRELADVIGGTDPLTLTEQAASVRAHAFSLERSERALTGRPPQATAAEDVEATQEKEQEARWATLVMIEMNDKTRAESIRSGLAVLGIESKVGPPADAKTTIRIVDAKTFLAGKTRDRQDVLTLVLDVAGTDEMRECIRRGASDVMLSKAPDSDVTPRVQRLIRRRR